MVAIPHTITVPKEQEEFLNDNPEISLSKITQNALTELMEMSKISIATIKEANRKMNNWMQTAGKLRDFLEKKGLIEEYLNESMGTRI